MGDLGLILHSLAVGLILSPPAERCEDEGEDWDWLPLRLRLRRFEAEVSPASRARWTGEATPLERCESAGEAFFAPPEGDFFPFLGEAFFALGRFRFWLALA